MSSLNRSRRRWVASCLATGATGLLAQSLSGCASETDSASGSNTPQPITDPDIPGTVKPLGARVLGLVATEPATGDFGTDVIQRIKNSGATATSLSVYWDDIEETESAFNPEPNYLAISELFYPPFGLSVTLAFSVIDTTNKRLPPDLAGRSFDDPLVISRFNAMLDWAATQIPSVDAHVISIGNEVDIYLNANPLEWPAWRTFFEQTSAHARTLWPKAVVGCKATFNGLLNEPSRSEMTTLNQFADGVFVTYYAIEPDFGVSPAGSVLSSMDELVSYAASIPIYILEHGCPSAPLLGSGELVQADFITETFAAWDKHADQIRQIEFFTLHDFNPSVVSDLETYYGFVDVRFAAYLGTLGLRTYAGAGVDKLAWGRFQAEVAARL